MDRIVVASHLTPCGRSWVDNILVALRVKWSYTEQFDDWVHIWDYDSATRTHQYKHRAKPQGFVKKYCPAVLEQDLFHFRDGIEAITTHSLPRGEWMSCKKIYVARDFKSALISAYKRRSVAGTAFSDFIAELDPDLMLPLYLGMQYHAESWLRQPRLHLVRQEDYRCDPERQLERLVDFLGIDVAPPLRLRALELAARYTPNPTEVEAQWRDDIAMLEARCRGTLRKLGYDSGRARPGSGLTAADFPNPRSFVSLAIRCGIHANVELWDGMDDAGSAPADEEARTRAVGRRATVQFDDIDAFLAPVTRAVLNLHMGERWRAVYGQPVGPLRQRGNMREALRLVDNAQAIINQLAIALRAEADPPCHHADRATGHNMVERASENLLLQSEHMEAPAWHTEGVERDIVGAAGAAPSGQCARLTTTGAAGRRTVSQLVPLAAAQGIFTFSLSARPGTLKDVMIQCTAGTAWCAASFDVEHGKAYRRTAMPGARVLSASVSPIDGGWIRIAFSFQFDVAVDALHCRLYLMQDCGVLDFDGAAGDHLLLYGAQLETSRMHTE